MVVFCQKFFHFNEMSYSGDDLLNEFHLAGLKGKCIGCHWFELHSCHRSCKDMPHIPYNDSL